MSKKSRKEIYIYICNFSKSLKTALQINNEHIKILDKTEEIEINCCKHLVYYGVLEASPNSFPYCKKYEVEKNGYRKNLSSKMLPRFLVRLLSISRT